jgi:soluble lytic murein transglycosylase-like protein
MNPGQLNLMFDASKTRYDGMAVRPVPKPRKASVKPPSLEAKSRRPVASRLHQELVVPIPRDTPSYRRTFKAMLANPNKTDRWDELILRYARIYHLDSRLMKSIMAAESEFDPAAVSPSGARGLMQVMPETAQTVGISAGKLNKPASGVKAGAAYLQVLFKAAWKIFHLKGVRYTDAPLWVVQRVIAAYHAGPKFLTRLDLHPTTRSYVRKVVHFYGSKVTDLRRPSKVELDLPVYTQTNASSGSMY